MLEGRVRSAVRLLTEHGVGGVPDPVAEVHGKIDPLGKSIYEVVKAKRPVQRSPDPSAFLECESLPRLEYLDITTSHIEKVARHLFGSAGPSGTGTK